MVGDFQVVLYFGINLLLLYTLNSAIHLFLKPNPRWGLSMKALIWFLYLTLATSSYYIKTTPAFNIGTQILLVVLVISLFTGGLKSKILVCVAWITCTVLIELLVATLYSTFLDVTLEQLAINTVTKLVGTLIAILTILVALKGVHLYKKKKKNYERFSFLDPLQVAIIPFCSIFIIYAIAEIAIFHVETVPLSVVISLFLLVFMNIFFYFLFDSLRKNEKIKYENTLLKNQSEYYIRLEQSIRTTYERVGEIKHDLSHHLLYLKAKMEENTTDSMQEVSAKLDLLLGDILSDDIKLYTKNPKINRILNYKLLAAYKKNIEMDIRVNVPQKAIIDESSLYSILGNAIDNAIEGYNDSIATEKKLTLHILVDHENLYIKIQNPYAGTLYFKNGLPQTTKENKSLHGLGLKSIKNQVENNNNAFTIKTQNNVFSLEILLYNGAKQEKKAL